MTVHAHEAGQSHPRIVRLFFDDRCGEHQPLQSVVHDLEEQAFLRTHVVIQRPSTSSLRQPGHECPSLVEPSNREELHSGLENPLVGVIDSGSGWRADPRPTAHWISQRG